jgi:hypothetical protein
MLVRRQSERFTPVSIRLIRYAMGINFQIVCAMLFYLVSGSQAHLISHSKPKKDLLLE